ncbi:ABC transporter ATP-binding protein [Phocicoccus pinnipedialis]|uniref:Putative siderophore transport system ATP-binding protein YusV n=1 Tax=Phocicoccus pinnipedialis TaxID=110845 RepID=A0A6V7R0X8_9BACL|nr:ATP-binding cassette domain-containing protein [Jeotgalicoccus pinnipedialis]MBP1938768.1 iron complex transport system ATP-binding protein [Jeotgalicoccus pinnipedialis]CAD2070724.1 putative siderophore transport system ATP-binding protein YusV [Jeotgalicoccus pinnipedialis]
MIQIRGLTKAYGEKKVVEDVSLDIEKGKLLSLIGPNGAGKSTVISMVTRLLDKNSGEVLLEGEDLFTKPDNELAKKISILKQSNNLDLNITVRELIAFGRYPYCKGRLRKEDNEKIDEAIKYMGLGEFEDRMIDELSGGQRQRVYIAMTIAQDTEYIFLDEPLNNLDMKHSVQIMQILRRLCRERNKTIIIVIHDINFASCYSDNIVALKDGKLAISGTKDEVIQENILREIYEIDIQIQNICGHQICIYFDGEEAESKELFGV